MAKGKNLNPADAYRKSLRKKEIKKNKTERSKARDFALVKKDTHDIEDQIKELEGLAAPSASDKSTLANLKSELEKINKKKAEYVEEHPEQRRLIYRGRRTDGEKDEELKPPPRNRNKFDKNGLPRHPERSIYYDPVMNPFGVAPPGMPYMERPLRPDEVDSDEEMDEDEDDDIPLPPGLPPGTEEVGSDEDIPMPDGPPPTSASEDTHLPPSLPAGFPPLPPMPPSYPPLPPSMVPPPPPPAGFAFQNLPPPPPPPGFPLLMPQGFPPPPPPGFPNFPPNAFPSHNSPPPPPGFFPRRSQSSASIQDPLSSTPYQTFQAHRASQLSPHPSLPQNPAKASASSSLPPRPTAAADLANATVFAKPQLRDLKKEATAFVPSALKRKKAAVASGATAKLDAAPSVGPLGDDVSLPPNPARPDLLSTLKEQFGPRPTTTVSSAATGAKGKGKESGKPDDYAKFVEEMGDILGSKP